MGDNAVISHLFRFWVIEIHFTVWVTPRKFYRNSLIFGPFDSETSAKRWGVEDLRKALAPQKEEVELSEHKAYEETHALLKHLERKLINPNEHHIADLAKKIPDMVWHELDAIRRRRSKTRRPSA